jgi:hypothetical protein
VVTVTTTATSSGEQPTKRKASPVTTSRKKRAKGGPRIYQLGRCWASRKILWYLLETETQKAIIRDFPNNHRCYGTVKSGSTAAGYNIIFDILPEGEQEVFVKRQNVFAVAKGAEEPTYGRETDDPEHFAKAEKKKKERTPLQVSSDAFVALEIDIAASAKTYDMVYDDEGNKIVWKILEDKDQVTSDFDPMVYPEDVLLKKDIDFGPTCNMSAILFEHFLPDIKGHAKLIDKFHSSTKSPYHVTVMNEKIVFDDPDDDDPDWKVKQAYLLIVAAATESEKGVV